MGSYVFKAGIFVNPEQKTKMSTLVKSANSKMDVQTRQDMGRSKRTACALFIGASPVSCTRFLSQNSRHIRSRANPIGTQADHRNRRCRSTPNRRATPPKLSLSLPLSLPPATSALLGTAATAATPFALWAVLIGAATLGMITQRYQWGRALTPPLVATLFTLLLSNFGLLPVTHPIYNAVTSFIVPLSVPLILLGADLRRVVSQTGRILPVYIVGSIATCIGTLAAWYMVPLRATLGAASWKIAAALTARHIGGAVNYVAVADATAAPAEVVTAALTADNVVVALYFVLLLLLARNVSQPPVEKSSEPMKSASLTQDKGEEEESDDTSSGDIKIADAAVALSISAILCTIAAFASSMLPFRLGVIPVVTAFVVALATLIPKQLEQYQKAATALGIFFLQIFFAVAGAGGSLVSVIQRAPVLLIFSTVQILVHLAFLLFVGRIFRFDMSHMLLASNANVGGPATAAAMARSKSWDSLVLPALLIGVFGYSIATFVSLGLGAGVLRFL